ncbi:MAG: peptidase Ste24p [Verrucomicrobiales bacterium]|nr:peptidase Ste24p [Verrucomicrobiales bacterium]
MKGHPLACSAMKLPVSSAPSIPACSFFRRRPLWAPWLAPGLCLLLCQCACPPKRDRESKASPTQAGIKSPAAPRSAALARWARVTPRLAAVAQRDKNERLIDWRFTVMDADGRNAHSWPDGRVEVTEGMLSFVRTDGELAAVLGHEMAHVVLRHGRTRAAASWAAVLGGVALAVLAHEQGGSSGWESAAMGGGAVFSISLTGLKNWHRSQELAADAASVPLLVKAGYPARSAADFWELYAQARQAEGRTGGGWWKSHPPDVDRVARLRALAEKYETSQPS